MEIDYDNTEVEKLFNDFDLMKKKTDAVFTRQVKKRYDQIKSFDNFADFLNLCLGKPHPLYENLKGCYGVFTCLRTNVYSFVLSQRILL